MSLEVFRGKPDYAFALHRRYAARYGADNPSLFHGVVAPALAPVPQRVVQPACYPLESKDPLKLWRNADYSEHASLVRALETLPNNYIQSVAWLRAHRPRGNHAAGARFWDAPLARAHALNAVMCRGGRTIVQVHLDAELKHDRLYNYMLNWNVDYARIPSSAALVDGSGVHYEVRLKDLADSVATVRVAGYNYHVQARYDSAGQVFRTSQVLQLSEKDLVPTTVAATCLGLTETVTRQVLPLILSDQRVKLVAAKDMQVLVPLEMWRADLDTALREANPCSGCLFFNHHSAACGLDDRPLPERGTAAYACSDHEVYA